MNDRTDCAELLKNAADCVRANDLESARALYARVIELDSRHATGHVNLGIVFQAQGRLHDATRCFERAIELEPSNAAFHIQLGVACFEQGLLREAAASFETALSLEPGAARAHNNLGYVRYCLGEYDDAERHYQAALALDPAAADANWNRCMLHLLRGELEHAWKTFHYRHIASPFPRRTARTPVWRGEALNGETVVLYKEHGLGDTIQFARYAQHVAERGARVVFEVQSELMRLFQTLDGVDLLVRKGAELPEHDYECSIMDLPGVFGTTLGCIPPAPYLSANPVLAREWRKRLPRGFSVGLVWAGNPRLANDRNRSIAFDRFAPLMAIDGIECIALQKGSAAGEAWRKSGMRLTTIGEALADFADTAAVIENLDLVISVDTSVAHLAGALGKPVWLLLPYVPDWRWLLGRDDSPWYATMKLFRQPEPGNWTAVIERVTRELSALAQERRKPGLMERLKARFAPT